MKNIWLVLLLAVPLGCQPPADSSPSDSNTTSAVQSDVHTTQVVFAVDGMACEVGCPPVVKDALASVPGVKNVNVDFAAKQAKVDVVEVEFDQLAAVKALSDAGFIIAKM